MMKTRLIKYGLFLVLLLLLTAPLISQAVDSPAKAGAGQRLKTIIVDNYHPYTFMNDKGEADGFSVEIARAVSKAMDLELEIRADKWDQAMKELEAGSIDLLPMMAQSPERDIAFDFSVPHTIAYDAIFLKKGTTGIRTLKDLSGKTVIVMNRDIAHSYLLSSGLSKRMTVNLVDSLPEALKQLAAGKGDAAIMPKLVGIVTAKKLNLSEIETSPQLIDAYTRPFSFAVKDDNQALLERLNQGLNIIKSSGEYDAIYKKWFGALEDSHLELKTVLRYGAVAALLLLGFVVWNIMLKRQVKSKTEHLEIEIAEHKRVEEEKEELSQRLKLAVSSARFGVWDWNVRLNTMEWDDRMFELYGITQKTPLNNIEIWINGLHPDDKETAIAECQAALKGEKEFDSVFRVLHPDGTVKHLKATALVIYAADGTAERMIGVNSDITESRQLQDALRKHLITLTQPLDDPTGIQFSDLFNLDELQHIQDAFAEATGVASIITSPDGIPITAPSNFCRLCNDIIRKSEKGMANCIKSDSVLGKCNPSGPIVQPCMSGGLWDGGASITVGGRHIANWLIGQVRNEAQDEAKMLEYADEIGVDREMFRAALAEVPTMSKERFDKVALALYLLANELSMKAYQNTQQARFIAERKVYETELQQKNAELERFTYTVSHDLKSPLITIKGFTGSLEKDLAKGKYERMSGDLKRVSDAADKMNDLLRDLLELSTIGRVINSPETVDMNLLVADVLAQLAGPLKNRNLTVAVQPGLPEVLCDRRRMAEVLQNLLENAINYMGDQTEPQIQFGMQEEAGENIFFVQDNGIGIDEKFHQIIFGLFNKLNSESSGTGIGLALVKRIIEVHGGKVWVESEGNGKGSRFCFTIKEAAK